MKKFVRFFSLCALFVLLCCSSILMFGCGPVEFDMSGIELNNQTKSYNGKPQRPLLSFTKEPPQLPQIRYEYELNGKSVESAILPGTYNVKVLFDVDTTKYKPVAPLEATMTISLIGSKFKVSSSNYKYLEIRSEDQIAFVGFDNNSYIWRAHLQQTSDTVWSIVSDNSIQYDIKTGYSSSETQITNTILEFQDNGTVTATQTFENASNETYTLTPQD